MRNRRRIAKDQVKVWGLEPLGHTLPQDAKIAALPLLKGVLQHLADNAHGILFRQGEIGDGAGIYPPVRDLAIYACDAILMHNSYGTATAATRPLAKRSTTR